MPTRPVPSKPSVPGSGTVGGVLDGVPSPNPVLLVHWVRLAAEQTWSSTDANEAALSPVPVMVKVKVLVAVLPAPVMFWMLKTDPVSLKGPGLLFFKWALTPVPRLTLVIDPLDKPKTMSPPFSLKSQPLPPQPVGFMVMVTVT